MKIAKLETFTTRLIGFVRVTSRQRRGGLGAGLHLQRRHHLRGPPPPGRAARARHRRARLRRHDRADRREGVQVSRHLPPPRDRRARHRAVGPAGQGRGQAGDRADRRHARAIARLWQLDAPRHHAGGRGRPAVPAARREGLHRLQVARRQGVRPRRRPVARPDRGDRADGRQGAGRRRRQARRRQFRLHRRPAPSRSAACSRTTASRTSRSPAPIGNTTGPGRSPTPCRSTSPAASRTARSPSWKTIIGTRSVDVVQPDILYLGGICRTLQVARHGSRRGPCPAPPIRRTTASSPCARCTSCARSRTPAVSRIFDRRSVQPAMGGRAFRRGPYDVVDGQVVVTDAPGWGVTVNPTFLSSADHAVSEAA